MTSTDYDKRRHCWLRRKFTESGEVEGSLAVSATWDAGTLGKSLGLHQKFMEKPWKNGGLTWVSQ